MVDLALKLKRLKSPEIGATLETEFQFAGWDCDVVGGYFCILYDKINGCYMNGISFGYSCPVSFQLNGNALN